MSTTLYELIGVNPAASAAEVEGACLKLGERYRPDKNPGDANAARIFAFLEGAFATLSDPVKRAAYDASIGIKARTLETPLPLFNISDSDRHSRRLQAAQRRRQDRL